MSNFWAGVKAETTYDMGGGEPIPNDTTCLGAIEEAQWKQWQDKQHISIRWRIAAPSAYNNRVVFQKLHVYDAAKADRAKRMLAAIDANAGGKLLASGQEPDDEVLMRHLVGKMMKIKVMVWEIDGKAGNWIAAVSAKGSAAPAAQPAVAAPVDDDNIPF